MSDRHGTGALTWKNSPPPGVWMAFDPDGPRCVPFVSELDALRYAVGSSLRVKYAAYGVEDWRVRTDPAPVTQETTYRSSSRPPTMSVGDIARDFR